MGFILKIKILLKKKLFTQKINSAVLGFGEADSEFGHSLVQLDKVTLNEVR